MKSHMLHLSDACRAASAAFDRFDGQPPTDATSPLPRKPLDDHAAIFVDCNDLNGRASSQFRFETPIAAKNRPRGNGFEEGRVYRLLV
jgi:hypothetical protein